MRRLVTDVRVGEALMVNGVALVLVEKRGRSFARFEVDERHKHLIGEPVTVERHGPRVSLWTADRS